MPKNENTPGLLTAYNNVVCYYPMKYFPDSEVTILSKHIIRLTSVTYAIRAQKLLEQRGIRAYIKKLVKSLSIHGCGYGLEISGDLNTVIQILSSAGIRIVEVVEGGPNS